MRYCKIQGKNEIYEVKRVTKDIATLVHDNKIIKIDVNNVEYLPEDFVPQKRNTKTNITIHSNNVPNEIMLRHKFKEEAISELDKYIDQAVIENLGRIRIIHGRHGGVLREAVHEYLKTNPYVKEFYLAGYSEGGIGVTIAVIGKK